MVKLGEHKDKGTVVKCVDSSLASKHLTEGFHYIVRDVRFKRTETGEIWYLKVKDDNGQVGWFMSDRFTPAEPKEKGGK